MLYSVLKLKRQTGVNNTEKIILVIINALEKTEK